MCGIVGCKLKRPLNDGDLSRLRTMRDALAYRGPDGKGEFFEIDKGLYLGHRRLSIIDTDKRSAQPMRSERQTLSYNGEIYNYLELRKELEARYQFKTESDTEVLLHGWDHWGKDALMKLDGMFAFALYDKAGLHIATDFFGEKPLYILENEDEIYFSSEAAPLIKTFNLQWTPDARQLSEFFHLGYIEPPQTGYAGLTSVLPGSYVHISHEGTIIEKTRYWIPPKPHIHSGTIRPITDHDIDQVRDVLCNSLEKRLRSDVPMGLFLSGGVDSALCAALAKNELGVDLQSYTTAFPDGQDETAYAKSIAEHLSIPHTVIHSQQVDTWQNAPQNLLNYYSTPNDNMTVLAIADICKAAKECLTVALTGLGGDELFYGYNKYKTLYKNELFYKRAGLLSPLLNTLSTLPVSKFKTAHELLKGSPERQFLRVKNSNSQDEVEQLVETLDGFLSADIYGLAHQARYFDLVSTMPQSYIPATERGSMRQSVELRTPFLNRALLDLTMSFDQRALIDTEKKYVLRRLLERYIPLDLLTPRKQGFVYPISRYFGQTDQSFACSDHLRQNHERLALRQCVLSALES